VKEQERALEVAEMAESKKMAERRTRAQQNRDAGLAQLEDLKVGGLYSCCIQSWTHDLKAPGFNKLI
jgi:hypothetical protein